MNATSKGILWKAFSCICYAIVNAIIRYLSGGSSISIDTPLPVYTILIFSYAFGALFMLPKLMDNNHILLHTSHPWLHLTRLIIAISGICFWYLSLQYMPILYATVIGYTSPIITIVGSILVLKERITIRRASNIALCFVGVIILTRPNNSISQDINLGWLISLPLIAASLFAADKIVSRKLMTLQESPSLLTFYLLIFTGPICIIPAIFFGWVTPDLTHLPWLLGLGLLAIASNYAYGKAYVFTEVTLLMPFSFPLKLIASGLAGYLAFGEFPKSTDMWVGVLLIIFSSIILSYKTAPTRIPASQKI